MSGFEPSEYTLYEQSSPGNGIAVEPGSCAAIVFAAGLDPVDLAERDLAGRCTRAERRVGSADGLVAPVGEEEDGVGLVVVGQDRRRLVLEDDVVRVLLAVREGARQAEQGDPGRFDAGARVGDVDGDRCRAPAVAGPVRCRCTFVAPADAALVLVDGGQLGGRQVGHGGRRRGLAAHRGPVDPVHRVLGVGHEVQAPVVTGLGRAGQRRCAGRAGQVEGCDVDGDAMRGGAAGVGALVLQLLDAVGRTVGRQLDQHVVERILLGEAGVPLLTDGRGRRDGDGVARGARLRLLG